MNWEAIGVGAEVLGASGVIITLAYLAVQIRKQMEEARLTATRDLAAQMGSVMQGISEDEGFAAIWLKGVHDYEALPDVDRIRISFFFHRSCRIMEQEYQHLALGNLDRAYHQSADNQYAEFFSLPGVQRWWELTKHSFEPEFQSRVDHMIANGTERGYDSTFRKSGN